MPYSIKLLAPNARLVRTFEACNHVAAMQAYYDFHGRGTCTTEHAVDGQPHPDAWAWRQRGEG